jgi:restriction system protein
MPIELPILIKNPFPVTDEHAHWRLISREATLDEISRIIGGNHYRCIHISGPPGIGKTFVGFFYAHSREVQRWMRVRRNPFNDFLIEPSSTTELHVEVLDGLDEYEDPPALLSRIEAYLNKHSNARIVFTAREGFEIPDFLSAVTYPLTVKPFSNTETHAFLGQLDLDELTTSRIDIIHQQLGGNPALLFQLSEVLYSGKASVQQLLDYIDLYYWPGLVDASGAKVRKGSDVDRQVIDVVETINEALLSKLAKNPALVHELSPRNFEDLVAELLTRQGYNVQLTPATRDGGKDIYAVANSTVGTFLYVVECKKYAPGRPVGVAMVRNLYGVVQAERASAGMLVTTSSFTKSAIEWQRPLRYQLSLRDFGSLKEWLASLKLSDRENPILR